MALEDLALFAATGNNPELFIQAVQKQAETAKLERQKLSLQKILPTMGYSPEEAAAMAGLNPSTATVLLNQGSKPMVTIDESGKPVYTRQRDAIGAQAPVKGEKVASEKKLSALEQKQIQSFTGLSKQAQQDKEDLSAAIDAIEKGGVTTGTFAGSKIGRGVQKIFNNKNVSPLETAMSRIQALGSKINSGEGSVSNYERALYAAATGVDWDKDEKTVAKQLRRAMERADQNAKQLDEWNKVKDTGISPIDFAADYQGEVQSGNGGDDGGGGAKPNATAKVIKYDASGKRIK